MERGIAKSLHIPNPEDIDDLHSSHRRRGPHSEVDGARPAEHCVSVVVERFSVMHWESSYDVLCRVRSLRVLFDRRRHRGGQHRVHYALWSVLDLVDCDLVSFRESVRHRHRLSERHCSKGSECEIDADDPGCDGLGIDVASLDAVNSIFGRIHEMMGAEMIEDGLPRRRCGGGDSHWEETCDDERAEGICCGDHDVDRDVDDGHCDVVAIDCDGGPDVERVDGVFGFVKPRYLRSGRADSDLWH
jgi:hypothetical protein